MIAFEAEASITSDSVTLPVPDPMTLTRIPSSWRRCNDVTSGSMEPCTSALTTRLRSPTSPSFIRVKMSSSETSPEEREASRSAARR